MPLSDLAIKALKPGPKAVKVSDEKGLFLLLTPSGSRLWRFKYRFNGKEKKLAFGSYPEIPLKEARRRRDEARSQIAHGIDPSEAKRALADAEAESARNSFSVIAEEHLQLMEKVSEHGLHRRPRNHIAQGARKPVVFIVDARLKVGCASEVYVTNLNDPQSWKHRCRRNPRLIAGTTYRLAYSPVFAPRRAAVETTSSCRPAATSSGAPKER